MAAVVGGLSRVVDAPGLTIDEWVGNVSTGQDSISVAQVSACAGTSEPWLTLDYEEWLCVTKGCVSIEMTEGSVEVSAGQTVHIQKGTRFKPSFGVDTAYIPVCVPAFRPDRCAREDTEAEGHAISANLRKLHGMEAATPAAPGEAEEPAETLYHMCPREAWEACERSGDAYYPPTFAEDGHLTHATAVPARLIATANHYYQDQLGDWICLEFSRSALRKRGIFVRDEHATPVGDKATDDDLMSGWVCPHVMGGIPGGVVTKVRAIIRDGPAFLSIEGL